MLLIKTKIDKSLIHGVGLFAEEDIPKGTLIWQWDDILCKRISIESVEQMDTVQKEYIRFYGWIDKQYPNHFCLSLDNERFSNHSTTPNLDVDNVGFKIYANRNILKGEELTQNYYEFCDDSDFCIIRNKI